MKNAWAMLRAFLFILAIVHGWNEEYIPGIYCAVMFVATRWGERWW